MSDDALARARAHLIVALDVPDRASAVALADRLAGHVGMLKDELVLFRQKLENRSARCGLGFLVSWNGFAKTVTKEMLRGSKEAVLVVPIDGKQLRRAVHERTFSDVLFEACQAAVMV